MTLGELEARVQRSARWSWRLLWSFAGIGALLSLINAITLNDAADLSLAQRWWSLIPMSAMSAMAAVLAARSFWLLPRELAARQRLVAARALHRPWVSARANEDRILGRLASLPEVGKALASVLEMGRGRMSELAMASFEGEASQIQRQILRRRAVMIDTYRVALSTVEVDSLLKKGYLRSPAAGLALEAAVEKLDPGKTGEVVESDEETASHFESIAVLPFADLSPLGDQEYFSQGLADELITALTRIQGLRVTARGLAFSVAEQDLSVREIGRRLGVATVLEGSVQKTGERLRVTAQLVAVAVGEELWSRDFDGELRELSEVGQQLVDGVVRALGVPTSAEEKRALEKMPTEIAGAHDYYLRGRRYFAQYHGRGMEFALRMYSRAIELDDRFALAWAGIADCCAFLYANSGRDPEHRQRALEASDRALELDPELAEAHVARGIALSQGERPDQAGQFFETALRLNPRLFEAHYFYARHHFTAGDAKRALEYYESAALLRPEDYQVPLLSSQIYDDLGRREDAVATRERGVRAAEEHLELNPDDARALYIGANGLISLGQIDKGLEWARLARELQPNEPMTLYNLACIYSLAGRADDAIGCFAACVEHGFSYREWALHDSNFDPIREDPRFCELMREV